MLKRCEIKMGSQGQCSVTTDGDQTPKKAETKVQAAVEYP